ncbi:ATP-binding cassette domain-containing protein [Eubacterium sp. 1001713B170207_170306_E7]|uniref:ATP-binding cassette domain-containing protein n=1 Tax=Eubacterium sp. 1001713B170207_170306_E7 TaxID=2787097 RepID=UPI00189C1F29
MFEICNLKFKDILDIESLIIDRPITCIIGSSGSGKTTLLKHLNKLYTPDSGAVFYNGRDLADVPAVSLRREVVMLGQTPVIYNGDLEENLQAGLRFSEKLPAPRDRLLKALERVKLDKPLDDPCISLSGGEKQRLCLARVMLMDAEIYLLDEPSAALDKETEHFIITNLADFVLREKKALIMVTHSEEVSSLYPGGIVRIENGQTGGYAHE